MDTNDTDILGNFTLERVDTAGIIEGEEDEGEPNYVGFIGKLISMRDCDCKSCTIIHLYKVLGLKLMAFHVGLQNPPL